jgi:hypothetical protein
LNPQIEFKHVLGELSVNRNDPCEVIRELISNSYDAGAKNIYYAPLKERKGFIFLDDGSGLTTKQSSNGISPWEAFFSIGKSTKKQGEAIGYKCQGSKLCFASSRVMVASLINPAKNQWNYVTIDNPRNNLDTSYNITPKKTIDISQKIDSFFSNPSADTARAIKYIEEIIINSKSESMTLIIIDELDTENFAKYFAIESNAEESYVVNYIRLYTRHGDIRYLTQAEGFSGSQRQQVSASVVEAKFYIFANRKAISVPFGYPYLAVPAAGKQDPTIKSPNNVSRLRDGRFYSRAAKTFSVGGQNFSIILAIDGNRRAHAEYKYLARKGKAMSGIKLSEHRGFFVAVKGIKICKYQELLSSLDDYEVLSEGDSPSHYSIILDGDFDLVTNRNMLSKNAYDTLSNPDFIEQIKKFLDAQKKTDIVFSELLSRLRKESSETALNEQIENLQEAKKQIKDRERFRIKDLNDHTHLFLSPQAGEEYLVGILYSQLSSFLPKNPGFEKYWRRIVTFSTQGIDSLGLINENSQRPLVESNVCSVEYKFEFNNNGPFNHALAVVDYIVAWCVDVDVEKQVKDSFTCFGNIRKVPENDFEWEISKISDINGGQYPQKISVICLKSLILQTFETEFEKPPTK